MGFSSDTVGKVRRATAMDILSHSRTGLLACFCSGSCVGGIRRMGDLSVACIHWHFSSAVASGHAFAVHGGAGHGAAQLYYRIETIRRRAGVVRHIAARLCFVAVAGSSCAFGNDRHIKKTCMERVIPYTSFFCRICLQPEHDTQHGAADDKYNRVQLR